MDVGLRDLAEDEQDLDDLALHVRRCLTAACHHVQKRGRKGIKQALADEEPAKIILCGGRTLQLEHAPDPVERVNDQLALFRKVLIEEVDEDLQPSTPLRWEKGKRKG